MLAVALLRDSDDVGGNTDVVSSRITPQLMVSRRLEDIGTCTMPVPCPSPEPTSAPSAMPSSSPWPTPLPTPAPTTLPTSVSSDENHALKMQVAELTRQLLKHSEDQASSRVARRLLDAESSASPTPTLAEPYEFGVLFVELTSGSYGYSSEHSYSYTPVYDDDGEVYKYDDGGGDGGYTEVRTHTELQQAISQAAASSAKLVIDLLADISMTSELNIESDVAIRSPVGAVLSGGGATRLIYVEANGMLIVENITLREGYASVSVL